MNTPEDADLLATLTPHFVPEMDEAGKQKALEYYREIRGKSYEDIAVTMAVLHMITESATKMLEAKEKAGLVTDALWTPKNGFRKRYN